MPEQRLIVGRINGLFGVRGWVKVMSYTSPPDNILTYNPWQLQRQGVWTTVRVSESTMHGKRIVVRLEDCENRDQAALLPGADIAINQTQLPPSDDDEYYWNDLIGLQVINTVGIVLGTVSYLIETGANDVLVVKGERERLIPFVINQVVQEVNLSEQQMRVDWDADF